MAGRIDLAAVEASLRDLQAGFPWLNEGLESPRDRLDDEVILNLLAGYAYIDRAVAAGIDFIALGNLKHLLELNTIVLCGEEPSARRLNARHIAATERHFWDESRGGVRDIVEWHDRHRNETVWQRAAGVYIRILSEPQLYIEGNHRTGALVMSYLLVRDGKPPFVLTSETARGYFDPSTLITKTRKSSLQCCFACRKRRSTSAST
ncbi:MAG TPA: hypothetical protein VLR47_01670, partial [Rhodospirillales bacterium]|nr:hypothetical protein [Rhodospirillales bacterium]